MGLRPCFNLTAVLPLPLIQMLIPSLPQQPINPLKLIPHLLHHPLSATHQLKPKLSPPLPPSTYPLKHVIHVTAAKNHKCGTSTNASTLSPSANALIQPPYSKSFLILSCVSVARTVCTWMYLVKFRNFRNFSTMYMSPCRITLFKIYLHFVSSITKDVLLKIKKSFSCIPSIF